MIVKVGLLAEAAAAVGAGHLLPSVGRLYVTRQVPSKGEKKNETVMTTFVIIVFLKTNFSSIFTYRYSHSMKKSLNNRNK